MRIWGSGFGGSGMVESALGGGGGGGAFGIGTSGSPSCLTTTLSTTGSFMAVGKLRSRGSMLCRSRLGMGGRGGRF